jgi:hypothetical protein
MNETQVQVLEREFDRCSPWIKAALSHTADSHRIGDVKEAVMMGRAHLWPTQNGCVVTTFSDFPASRLCQLWLMGGDFNEVFTKWNDVIESWAKDQGCDQIIVNGRKGWQRRLKSVGYEFASVVLAKRI